MANLTPEQAAQIVVKLEELRDKLLDDMPILNNPNEVIAHTMNVLEALFIVINAHLVKDSPTGGTFVPITQRTEKDG